MKPVIISKALSGQSKVKGFVFNEFFITDPYTDETGRFDVNPSEYYGLTIKQMEILAREE
tara:strand:- start:692 stop:871 length:180 start_codon:yes stop_codon:yes gene_type:complete